MRYTQRLFDFFAQEHGVTLLESQMNDIIHEVLSSKYNNGDYIKKLERRIHNQRVALRENWMIVEERGKCRPLALQSRWFTHVLAQGETIQEQKKLICELREKLGEPGEGEHDWGIVDIGEYDHLHECKRCKGKWMESIDNLDSSPPIDGCK